MSALRAAVLVLGGPTASGKSDLAAELARAVGGDVVSADSRQVYRGLEIGTAQPEARLRRRAPHHLVGFLSPRARYTAADYGEDARRVLAALAARGRPAVLCGGTGLYLRAALLGVPSTAGGAEADVSIAERRALRAALARRWTSEGAAVMYAELARVDPTLAAGLPTADRQRVLRGLEFHALTGCSLSASRSAPRLEDVEQDLPLRYRLELDAEELDRRIRARIRGMLERGWLDEARALAARYGADPPASLSAVGYPELLAHLRGELLLEDALERVRLRTRQYAKRQGTWFRNQDGYLPVPVGERALEALLAAWHPRLGQVA